MQIIREHHQKRLRELEDKLHAVQREAAFSAELAEIGNSGPSPESEAMERIAGGRVTGGEPAARRLPDFGFKHMGQFFAALRSVWSDGPQDPRITAAMAAVTTFSSEGGGPEGGFAAPPAYIPGFLDAIAGIGTLLGAMNPQIVSSTIVQLAVDAGVPGGTSDLTASKTAEGAAATVSKPALQGRTITLPKAVGLCHVSEELMSDAPEAGDAISRHLAREVRAIVERWILRGSGIGGEPLGILNAPALIAVTGTGAGTLTTTHLGSAFGRFMAGPGSFIVAGPSATGALRKIEMDGGGRIPLPVISSLELPAVGTQGDAVLVNPDGFLTYARGVQAQITPIFLFDQQLNSIRVSIRVGQVPVLAAAVTPTLDTANTVSHSVAIATRT